MACTGYSAPAFRRCPQARGQGDYNHGAAALSGPCGIAGPADNRYTARLIWPKNPKSGTVTAVERDIAVPIAPNRLARNFTTDRPDQVWLAYISYIPSDKGWLYL